MDENGKADEEQSKPPSVEAKSTLASSRSKSKLEKEKLIKSLVHERVPRESKIMLLKILQSLSEFLFLIESDKAQGLDNYQAVGRVNKSENELEDLYQRFYLMPKKRKMLKACMQVLKLTRSRKLVD